MTARPLVLALAPALALTFALGLSACSDRDAPRPVSDLGSPPAAGSRPAAPPAVAATADPNDPAEPGIPDLARLARYVFRTMQRHEDACPVQNPFRDSLHFAFAIEVVGGRMARVSLGEVAVEGSAGKRSLRQAQWPDALVGYVTCLTPHLKEVVMSPAPADGAYEPVYSFGGQPEGKPAP
jgi:hypothetical protein